ncbi:TetR/AcrR family transcriptional regulator [Nocardia sp. CA2R105]|uniref:TetR/AcrR family transcriptional regulator n=1 Tax=Nocardia coffeae TaxID=2873381 RepID=UPI001CA67363|nr:TetR/AcrR family transcriptional regulator [Nocardia coffeae]MBY8860372.1 TetR/AcrR family transcriptional regulator [Nocardia coffeae]
MRRKPDAASRRRELCDAAIQLLAQEGPKGLSHPKVDLRAGVPKGTTSFYFRTREALLLGLAERLAELDLADLRSVAGPETGDPAPPPVSRLAVAITRAVTGDGLPRTRARLALMLQAERRSALAEVFRRNAEIHAELHREIVVKSLPPGEEADPDVISDLTFATLNFISGYLMSVAGDESAVRSAEQLDQILIGIADGVAARSRRTARQPTR